MMVTADGTFQSVGGFFERSEGSGCIIGACSLVTEKTVIPDNSLALGSPARVVRQTTEEERRRIMESAQFYIREAAHYKSE